MELPAARALEDRSILWVSGNSSLALRVKVAPEGVNLEINS